MKTHNRTCWNLLSNSRNKSVNSTPSAFGGWQIRLRGAELWNISWIFSGKISMVRVILKYAYLCSISPSPSVSCAAQVYLPMFSTGRDSSIHLLMTRTRHDAIPHLHLTWTRMLISARIKSFWKIQVVKHKLVIQVWIVKCKSYRYSRGKNKCSDSPFQH